MVIFEDGKGTGVKVQVNAKNEIKARATQHSEEHSISQEDEQAYFTSTAQTSTETLTFLTTETGDVLHIKNTGSTDITLSAIIASVSAAGGVITLTKNKTEGTITQNTTVVANNLNFGSANISTTTVDIWDETNGNGIQGLTNGDVLTSLTLLGSPAVIETAGTIIIPQGKTLTVSFNNVTGGTIEFSVGLRYYFDDGN